MIDVEQLEPLVADLKVVRTGQQALGGGLAGLSLHVHGGQYWASAVVDVEPAWIMHALVKEALRLLDEQSGQIEERILEICGPQQRTEPEDG